MAASLAVGQAIVFRGLPSSKRCEDDTTIVSATPGKGSVQLICGLMSREKGNGHPSRLKEHDAFCLGH
jgi:hypothetical protein